MDTVQNDPKLIPVLLNRLIPALNEETPSAICLYDHKRHAPSQCIICDRRLLSVLGDPLFCDLVKVGTLIFVLVGDARLDRIVGLRFSKDVLDQTQDLLDAVRRLPLVGA